MRNKSSRGRDIYIGADLEGLYSAYVWELIDAGIDVKVADVANHFVFANVGRPAVVRPDAGRVGLCPGPCPDP